MKIKRNKMASREHLLDQIYWDLYDKDLSNAYLADDEELSSEEQYTNLINYLNIPLNLTTNQQNLITFRYRVIEGEEDENEDIRNTYEAYYFPTQLRTGYDVISAISSFYETKNFDSNTPYFAGLVQLSPGIYFVELSE